VKRSPSGIRPSTRPEALPPAHSLSGEPPPGASGRVVVHDQQNRSLPGIAKCGSHKPQFVQYGARLRDARKALGWSQDCLARKWGCIRTTVISWERGKTLVRLDLLDWIESLAAQRRVG
jgi:DNA-binding XRE family transcriptional regulator